MNTSTPEPEKWLDQFGLTKFRSGQRHVIDAIFAGRDTLCIMPTGGGKSLCFQLPTVARDGVTIVISPLIALMKDQVDSLEKIGIPATFINSSLPANQQQARISGMINNEYKLVYIAPERLRSNSFMRAIDKTPIQLLAVDEAHCISHWGHDFRPDYARLGRFRKRLGNPQTVALTATATRLVQDDIAKILELNSPATFVTGFARSNLHLGVDAPNGNVEKDQRLIDFLTSKKGCGIIYASTRKSCEHLVELLEDKTDRQMAFYHAGLDSETRRSVQENFMSGKIEIIVATNAFGMGIDKADLRFVVHYNLPGSVEAYYQEAGRAGRDGNPSDCLMLYSFQDKFVQEFFIENSYPSRETIKQVYEFLRAIKSNPIELTLQEIKDDLGLTIGSTGIANCENLLEKANAIERLDSTQNAAAIRIDSDLPTLVDFLPREARTQRHVLRGLERIVDSFRGERVMFTPQRLATSLDMKWEAVNRAIRQLVKLPMINYIPPFRGRAVHVVDRSLPFEKLEIDFDELRRRKDAEFEKLQSVIKFATTRRCRQLEILEYFGDPDRQLCGNCDNCKKRPKLETGTAKVSSADACLYAAQVALSGTARTHGRIGKNLIAQMLSGSTSKKIKQLGLHRLSTFGLLKLLRQTDVVMLMEFLIQQGHINQIETTKFRPVAQLSDSGRELISGSVLVDLTMQMPSELVTQISRRLKGKKPHLLSAAAKPDGQQVREINDEKLAAKNVEPGRQSPLDDSGSNSGEVRESECLDDDFLDVDEADLEQVVDNDSDEFIDDEEIDVVDIGDVGIGDEIDSGNLEPIATPAQKNQSKSHSQPPPSSPIASIELPDSGLLKPTHYWTWRLLHDGYSTEHVEQIRKIDRATIFDHVSRALENGQTLPPQRLFSLRKLDELETFLESNATLGMSELLANVPAGISSMELLFYWKFKQQQSTGERMEVG